VHREQYFNKIQQHIQARLFRDNGNHLLEVHHVPNSAHHKNVTGFIFTFSIRPAHDGNFISFPLNIAWLQPVMSHPTVDRAASST
jgi:hypothetical protein